MQAFSDIPKRSKLQGAWSHKSLWIVAAVVSTLLLASLGVLCGYVGDMHNAMLRSLKLDEKAASSGLSYDDIPKR